MYIIKKILPIILVLSMVISFSGCSTSDTGSHVLTPMDALTQEKTDPSQDSIPDPDNTSEPPITTGSPTDTEVPDTEEDGKFIYKPFVPEEKLVCVTFDDGPNSYTAKILDKLEGTDSKVTFFVVGKRLSYQNYAPHTKRAIQQGHEIGFHSYGHEEKYTDLTLEEFQKQIADTNKLLEKLGGKPITITRPVEGIYNKNTNYGYPLILWNVDTEDWRVNSSIKNGKDYDTAVTELANSIVKQAKSGSIILLHDMYKCSADAFIMAYDILIDQGYKFVTVSEMLGIEGKDASGYAFRSSSTAYYYGVKCT